MKLNSVVQRDGEFTDHSDDVSVVHEGSSSVLPDRWLLSGDRLTELVLFFFGDRDESERRSLHRRIERAWITDSLKCDCSLAIAQLVRASTCRARLSEQTVYF